MQKIWPILLVLMACAVSEKFIYLPANTFMEARGNEPGWILRIYPTRRIQWVMNYGQDTINLNANDAKCTYTEYSVGKIKAQRLYFADKDLLIDIKNEACADDMSAEESDYKVGIKFGTNQYQGCAWIKKMN